MSTAFATDLARERPQSMRAVVMAGAIGTVMEWYDFLIYATTAALVFNKLFFPASDPTVGTLAALGSYAVGFFARPFGGMVFGHVGDRIGRKSMLMATLLLMGAATFLIGLLPTYAVIGVWAPILLVALRIVQGIGLGGEWGGAALMVIEHAPAARRGLYGSLVQVGFPLGIVLSTLAVSWVASLPEASFLSWGWRLPFLFSAVLFAFGAFVRARVAETPVFLDLKTSMTLSRNPIREAVVDGRGSFLTAVGLKLSEVSWIYMLTVFAVVYATTHLHLSKGLILHAITIAAVFELVSIPFFGWLSDRVGRRPLYIAGALFTIAFAFPLFWMLDSREPALVTLAVVVAMNLGHGMMFAPEATYFPELFEGPVRCTGASFGFQVSAAIGGGLTPLLATWLVSLSGGTVGVSILFVGLALVTLASAMLARETLHDPLIV